MLELLLNDQINWKLQPEREIRFSFALRFKWHGGFSTKLNRRSDDILKSKQRGLLRNACHNSLWLQQRAGWVSMHLALVFNGVYLQALAAVCLCLCLTECLPVWQQVSPVNLCLSQSEEDNAVTHLENGRVKTQSPPSIIETKSRHCNLLN